MGELVAGRYRIEAAVGNGGMATVFRAHDTLLERTVALKELDRRHAGDPAYVERFRSEARAAARLQHPNVVGVIDRLEEDGREFIVFEFVAGETLKERIQRQGPAPFADAARLGLGIARALAAAHAQGIAHRDVKPQNVLLGDDGRPRVADFGIARADDAEERTEPGAVVGTAAYLPPEHATGAKVGPEGDVYSLGCVLYELLTARPPFEAPSFIATAMRHVEEPVPDVRDARPDCPPELAALVARCMAKEPPARPTAAEVARELAAAASAWEDEAGRTAILPPPEAGARPRRQRASARRPRRGLAVAGGAAVAVAAVAIGAAVWLGGDESRAEGSGEPVALQALAAYDPEGDGTENDGSVASATDGDPATYWSTEGYDDFRATKPGVGLVLDAGSRRTLDSITIRTSLPGWQAEIRAGAAPDGPFAQVVSPSRATTGTTTWRIEGDAARYYVVWITALAEEAGRDHARVDEATARG